VTRPVQAAKAKGTGKMSEAMINENKDPRDNSITKLKNIEIYS
jgi:hypothetical protein